MGDLRASQFMCGNAYRAQRSVPAISPSNLDNLMAGLWWAIGACERQKWVRASAPDGEAEASTSIRVSHPLVRSTSQLRAQHRLRSANTVQGSRRAGIALGRKAATYRLLAGSSRAVGVRRSAVGQMAQPTAAAAIGEPLPRLKQPSTLVGERIYVQIFIERGPSKAANGSSLLTS